MRSLPSNPRSAHRPLALGSTVRRHDDILSIAGVLDMATAPRLDRILHWLEATWRPLCLDLRQVAFVDCAGWHVIVEAMTRARRLGRAEVKLIDMSAQVQRFTALFDRRSHGGWLPARTASSAQASSMWPGPPH